MKIFSSLLELVGLVLVIGAGFAASVLLGIATIGLLFIAVGFALGRST